MIGLTTYFKTNSRSVIVYERFQKVHVLGELKDVFVCREAL